MDDKELDGEIRELLERWNRSILDKDVAAAAELREEGYTATLPDGAVVSKEAELALIALPTINVESMQTRRLEVRAQGEGEATAVFDNVIEGVYMGQRTHALYNYTLSLRRTNGSWRARSSSLLIKEVRDRTTAEGRAAGPSFSWRKLVPRGVKSWIRGRVNGPDAPRAATFPELAYLPYKPGHSFVVPPVGDGGANEDGAELPVPPEELWLGYNYSAHGAGHVGKMLEIVRASGFDFERGDRVLDFGCGAGRMIRHLKDLTATCEVWGTDISAEHILWCKQHLSPPFHFATTTKVPHLPFEDRSFQFIYCGSVFTHIDELADAWLLELRRILAPGGRLYLTIHDEHTIRLFEEGRFDWVGLIAHLRADETYRKAKDSFGMFTVGRDSDAQVFYHTDYFTRTLRPTFDILSVTREAYFYQTAYLLKRD